MTDPADAGHYALFLPSHQVISFFGFQNSLALIEDVMFQGCDNGAPIDGLKICPHYGYLECIDANFVSRERTPPREC